MLLLILQLRVKLKETLVIIEHYVDSRVKGTDIQKYPPLLKLSIGRVGTKLMLYVVDLPVIVDVGCINNVFLDEVGGLRLYNIDP